MQMFGKLPMNEQNKIRKIKIVNRCDVEPCFELRRLASSMRAIMHRRYPDETLRREIAAKIMRELQTEA